MDQHPSDMRIEEEADENLWDESLAEDLPRTPIRANAMHRMIHLLADGTAAMIFYYAFLFFLIYLYSERSAIPAWLSSINTGGLLPGVIYLLLVFVMELLGDGQSVGKLITGHRVRRTDGSPAGFGRICIRTVVRIIPLEGVSIFFRRDRKALHDLLSGTEVIALRESRSAGEDDVVFDDRA